MKSRFRLYLSFRKLQVAVVKNAKRSSNELAKPILFLWIVMIAILLVSLVGCSDYVEQEGQKSRIEGRVEEGTLSKDDPVMKVHYLDVGQGDCTLVVCNGSAMLIDAGNNDKGTAIQLYLTKLGIKKLDYVIGTHPDSDHIGGLDVILYKFDCRTIIMPDCGKDTKTYDNVVQTMKNKNYKNTLPVVGTTYGLGGASFTILAPNDKYGKNANDYSVGILLSHGDNRFIFTGDAEEGSEADIVKNDIDISANVYKVSHHGSKSASTSEFMEAMDPEYAVVSCGEGNPYGHPHARTLNTLRAMGVKVFRTDEQGGIIATSNGKNITWNCSPSESWQVGEGAKSDKEDGETNKNTEKGKNKPVAEGTTYVINTNTEKFHDPTCTGVGEMKEKNKQETTQGRDDLISQGYSPCGRCKP